VEIVNGGCEYIDLEGEFTGYFIDTIALRNLSDGSTSVVDPGYPQECDVRSWYGFHGLFWTRDSRYFYYSNFLRDRPDRQDTIWPRTDYQGALMRIDVWPSTEYRSLSEDLGDALLSPNGNRFATWRWLHLPQDGLAIHEINQGEVLRFSAPEQGAHDPVIVWSRDSTSLVYLQSDGWNFATTLVLVDILKKSQTVLVQTNDARFTDVAWDEPGQIALVEQTYNLTVGRRWHYDLATGELKPPS